MGHYFFHVACPCKAMLLAATTNLDNLIENTLPTKWDILNETTSTTLIIKKLITITKQLDWNQDLLPIKTATSSPKTHFTWVPA